MFLNKKSISGLIDRSSKIVDIFTKTVSDLTTINAEAKISIEDREAEIKRISEENQRLNELIGGNQKVIDKITNIL